MMSPVRCAGTENRANLIKMLGHGCHKSIVVAGICTIRAWDTTCGKIRCFYRGAKCSGGFSGSWVPFSPLIIKLPQPRRHRLSRLVMYSPSPSIQENAKGSSWTPATAGRTPPAHENLPATNPSSYPFLPLPGS